MLTKDVEVKASTHSEIEIEEAWEICNKITWEIEDTDSWKEQYELSDEKLRCYLDALVIIGITEEQIGDVAAAIRHAVEPKDSPFPVVVGFELPAWRDPFALKDLWRLVFARGVIPVVNYRPEYSPPRQSLQAYLQSMAEYTGKELDSFHWPTILKERLEFEQYLAKQKAEERAEAAADPYRQVWFDERPLLLGYHDRQCMLPRYRDGGIGLIVGEKNHFKTTVTVMLLIEAMVSDPELHILYLAGEQPGDVKNKVVHYGAAAGLSRDDLYARFHIRADLPPLYRPENEEGVLKAASRFNAGVVVVDTYQHAITGLDENSSKAAELSTNSGIFGRLKSGGRLVLILGHPPADGSPRFRGNTGIEGAADFIITFRATHNKGSFKAEVINMRGTAAGAIAHATFPKVPTDLAAQERIELAPPDITWSTVRAYNAVTHDPRPRAETPAAELVAAVDTAPIHLVTRKEKAAERKRRQREREREPQDEGR